MKKMLVLYRELAGYFVSCVNNLSVRHNVRVDIIAYPVNSEAPFMFEFAPGVRTFRRADFSTDQIDELIRREKYDLIFCGGWSDKEYLEVIRRHSEVPSLLGFDKQWLGTARDFLGSLYLRWKVRDLFDYAFVPGTEQFAFARRMGFSPSSIVTGAYTCDTGIYESVYAGRERREGRAKPRQMWFAGRYVEEKCPMELWDHVAPLLDGPLADWELHCIGTGPLWEKRRIHSRIHHHGFVQPLDTIDLIREGEIFILPSKYEPWAMTVHEFAVVGYALLLSDKVGARCAFLEEGKNGDVFPSGDWSCFRDKLLSLCSKSTSEIAEMGFHSHSLASAINQETWAQSVLRMMRLP